MSEAAWLHRPVGKPNPFHMLPRSWEETCPSSGSITHNTHTHTVVGALYYCLPHLINGHSAASSIDSHVECSQQICEYIVRYSKYGKISIQKANDSANAQSLTQDMLEPTAKLSRLSHVLQLQLSDE